MSSSSIRALFHCIFHAVCTKQTYSGEIKERIAMLNYAVGPVPEDPSVRAVGLSDTPYFRTTTFSDTMLESERLLCSLSYAPIGSRAVFLSNSGTGAMEATVMGTLDPLHDCALVVDGGSFGHRFVQLLKLHEIKHDVIRLNYGEPLKASDLAPYEGGRYTAFLINLGETSQGILYDSNLVAEFCFRNNLFLIVDAISSFLADPFDMTVIGAGVMITDSQKALACPPGVAPIVFAPDALKRISHIKQKCMYFDLQDILRNGERGQTPFTPAVGILLQINQRLRQISYAGGAETEIEHCASIAMDFRFRIIESGIPLDMRLESPSNAVTYIKTRGFSARKMVEILQDEYGIWICPNGGAEADTSFRVGHIGAHALSDNAMLVSAFCDLRRRGFMEVND